MMQQLIKQSAVIKIKQPKKLRIGARSLNLLPSTKFACTQFKVVENQKVVKL
jgi:hypothetical protein